MSLFLDDVDVRLYQGDVRETLAQLEAESVHCVVTSPPYWGLRDYGTGSWEGGNPDCDHAQGRPGRKRAEPADGLKDSGTERNRDGVAALTRSECKCGASRVDNQLGLEPTPDLYIENMVEVFREVRRVLRADGTCWVNMGDSYTSQPNQRVQKPGGRNDTAGWKQDTNKGSLTQGSSYDPTLKPKDLCMIPARLALALQADGWWLRSQIVWSKPNPMPESVTDRPTTSHEFVYLLAKSPRYFFDQEAVREPADWKRWGAQNGAGKYAGEQSKAALVQHRTKLELQKKAEGSGRNLRSVWEIPTQPYPEAHFATYPEELVRRCILAGTSERGCCRECGAPWTRETSVEYDAQGRTTNGPRSTERRHESPGREVRMVKDVTTTGWRPSCNHDAQPAPCTVLDPFMGSGTTALVARKHGRNAVGVELNPDYCELAARRLQQLSLLAVQP